MGATRNTHATIKNARKILVSSQNEVIIWGTWVHMEGILKQNFKKYDVRVSSRLNMLSMGSSSGLL